MPRQARHWCIAAILSALAALGPGAPNGASTDGGPRAFSPKATMLVAPISAHYAADEPELDIAFDLSTTPQAPGRITIYVPNRFPIFPTRAVGSNVGTARLSAADYSGGSSTLSFLDGDVTARALDANTEAAAQSCSPGVHIGLWIATLSLLGQPLDLPIYLGQTRGSDPTDAAVRIDICPPMLPGTIASTAPTLPISDLLLRLPGVEPPNARGAYLWRAVISPLAPDGHSILPERAYELRSLVPVPHRLTLRGRYERTTQSAVLHGSLSAQNRGRPGIGIAVIKLIRTVTPSGVQIRDSYAQSTRTGTNGSYSLRVKITKTTGFIASASDATSRCTGTAEAPAGCASTTIAGLQSDPITISPTRG